MGLNKMKSGITLNLKNHCPVQSVNLKQCDLMELLDDLRVFSLCSQEICNF